MSSDVLNRLDGVLDELAGLSWDTLADSEVIETLRRVEVAKRRLAVVDHGGINQVEQRSLAFTLGARTTVSLLGQLLRVSRPEAAGRVRAAEALGVRRTITGQLVGPRFEHVAAAQARGEISDRHAAIITAAVDRLPDELVDQCGEFVEKTLTEEAHEFDPVLLGKHANTLLYALDQDGQEERDQRRHRDRSFEVHPNADGSSTVTGRLTAEATAHLLAVLDCLTKPRPSEEAGPDPRTATQRRHDAFRQILKIVERARLLPSCNGVTTTVVLTMSADSWMTGEGTAQTAHGYTIPASVAKKWAGLDCRLILTLLTKTRAVEAYSSTHRIFTETQRLAMLARDKGCTYPGCDTTLPWCEAHHIHDFATGGPTTVTNGALACCADHRDHKAMGWHAIMLNGTPHWIPPAWLDPEQKPRRNTMHD